MNNYFIEKFPKLDKENIAYNKSTAAEMFEILDSKKDANILFCFESCPWCQATVNVLNDVAVELDMNILYINRLKYELHDKEVFKEILIRLNDYLSNESGEKRLAVPGLFIIRSGEVIDYHYGSLPNHDATARDLTKTEIEELKVLYIKMLER